MSKGLALENLFRPPVELYSATCAIFLAIVISLYPMIFLLTNEYAVLIILCLLSFASLRGYQGFKIIRYHKHLHRLPNYQVSMDEIPVSQKVLFLGKGFKWLPIHTQRLRDLNKPENNCYAEPSRYYLKARAFERYAEQCNRYVLNQIAKLTAKDSWLNPVRPLPPVGGLPAIHGVSMHEEDITMPLMDRGNHTLVMGTTGVGKTRLAETLISQDIRRGDVVIVIDPKGDTELLERIYIESLNCGRLNELMIFHLGFPKVSAKYNPISNFTKITEVASRVANQLPGTGDSSAFKEFGWRFINIISQTLVALEMTPSYKTLRKYIYDIDDLLEQYVEKVIKRQYSDFEDWITFYKHENERPKKGALTRLSCIIGVVEDKGLDDEDTILKSLVQTCRYERSYYDKITASLAPLLDKLSTGEVADLISPDSNQDDVRPTFEWESVIKNRKIIYIGLDALTDANVAAAVGNAMLADLASVAGYIYKFGFEGNQSRTICLHVDEFNEIASDEFTQLLNKGRGAGFHITAYTQTISDLEVRLGTSAKAGQNLGNLNNLIMLRVKEPKTAELLINQIAEVPVIDVTAFSGANDAALPDGGVYFNSSNEDRLSTTDDTMVTVNDLLNLPKGQAFCLIEGGQLYKIRMPLPKPAVNDIPPSTTQLMQQVNIIHHSECNDKFKQQEN